MNTAPERRALNGVPALYLPGRLCEFRSLDSLIFRVANGFEITLDAFRLARMADTPTVPDYLVRVQNPLFARKDMYQVLLHFFRVSVFCEVETTRYAQHVGVDHHS
jgi:hypothetical protein